MAPTKGNQVVRCAHSKTCICVIIWKEIWVTFFLMHGYSEPVFILLEGSKHISFFHFMKNNLYTCRTQNLETFTKRAKQSWRSTKAMYQDFETSWTVCIWVDIILCIMEVWNIAVDHFHCYNLTHSSWSAFKIAGMLVADGGLGLTKGFTEITIEHWWAIMFV